MTKPAVTKRRLPSSPFKAQEAPPEKHFAVADRVTHDVHGLGRVIEVEEGIAVLVDFGSRRERITSPYAKMTLL
ncbi:hypothetical protein [Streptomyces sp. NPDC005322]|uniref:hypothetical protein n=1 Tax=unclassified Streptomyces TaxID=2593676 RepID=UPI0033AA580F